LTRRSRVPGLLGLLDRRAQAALLTCHERGEEALGLSLGGQWCAEVGWHRHGSRRRVELQLNLDLAARRNAGLLAVLGAHAE